MVMRVDPRLTAGIQGALAADLRPLDVVKYTEAMCCSHGNAVNTNNMSVIHW